MAKNNLEVKKEGLRVESPETSKIRLLALRDKNLTRLFIITILVLVLMSIAGSGRFLNLQNFRSMSYQFPEIGILGIAIMIAMLTGGIDLSVVGIANLTGILAALTMTRLFDANAASSGAVTGIILLAILISVSVGLLCGLINGYLIAQIGITPILATLGTMQLFTGFAVVITKGPAVVGYPSQFLNLGNGTVLGLPIPLLVFIVIAVVFAILLNQTATGLKIYLLGTNPVASEFSGINNKKILIRTYLISGLLAAIAGIVMIARTNSAKADYGTSYVLQSVLIAVLGGINPAGGFGKISGLILAILSLQFLSSGFNMLRFSNFFKDFIWGALLIVVMVINYLTDVQRPRFLVRGGRQTNPSAGSKE